MENLEINKRPEIFFKSVSEIKLKTLKEKNRYYYPGDNGTIEIDLKDDGKFLLSIRRFGSVVESKEVSTIKDVKRLVGKKLLKIG